MAEFRTDYVNVMSPTLNMVQKNPNLEQYPKIFYLQRFFRIWCTNLMLLTYGLIYSPLEFWKRSNLVNEYFIEFALPKFYKTRPSLFWWWSRVTFVIEWIMLDTVLTFPLFIYYYIFDKQSAIFQRTRYAGIHSYSYLRILYCIKNGAPSGQSAERLLTKEWYVKFFKKLNIPHPITSVVRLGLGPRDADVTQEDVDNDDHDSMQDKYKRVIWDNNTFEDILNACEKNCQESSSSYAVLLKPSVGCLGIDQRIWRKDKTSGKFYDCTKGMVNTSDVDSSDMLSKEELKAVIEDIVKDRGAAYVLQPYLGDNKQFIQKSHFLLRFVTLRCKKSDIMKNDGGGDDDDDDMTVVPILSEVLISNDSWTSHKLNYLLLLGVKNGDEVCLCNDRYNSFSKNACMPGDSRSFKSIENKIDMKEYQQAFNKTIYEKALEYAKVAHAAQYHEALEAGILMSPVRAWDILLTANGECIFLEGSPWIMRCTNYVFDSFDSVKDLVSLFDLKWSDIINTCLFAFVVFLLICAIFAFN